MLEYSDIALRAFILQVKIQSGKAISQTHANNLITNAQNILADLSKAQKLFGPIDMDYQTK